MKCHNCIKQFPKTFDGTRNLLADPSYLDTFNYSSSLYVGNGPGFNGNIGNIPPIPDVPIATAQINHPRGLAADYLGNLYFADEYNGSVRVITQNDNGEW